MSSYCLLVGHLWRINEFLSLYHLALRDKNIHSWIQISWDSAFDLLFKQEWHIQDLTLGFNMMMKVRFLTQKKKMTKACLCGTHEHNLREALHGIVFISNFPKVLVNYNSNSSPQNNVINKPLHSFLWCIIISQMLIVPSGYAWRDSYNQDTWQCCTIFFNST